jgi:hypothetical protein
VKYVITGMLLLSLGVPSFAAFSQGIGLEVDGLLTQRDYVAMLLHRNLPKETCVSLDDLNLLLNNVPGQEVAALVTRSKDKEMGTRAQLILRLLDNIKSLTDADLDSMRMQLDQKDREHQAEMEQNEARHERVLSQKNIENWTAMAITAAITGLLTWAFGANC